MTVEELIAELQKRTDKKRTVKIGGRGYVDIACVGDDQLQEYVVIFQKRNKPMCKMLRSHAKHPGTDS